jgi:hypothetical protein
VLRIRIRVPVIFLFPGSESGFDSGWKKSGSETFFLLHVSQEGYESDVEEDLDEESNDDPELKKMVEATEKMHEEKEKMDEAKEKMDEAKEKMDEAKEKIDEATEKTEDGLSTMQLDENKTERAPTDEKVTSMRVDESKISEGGEGEGGDSKEPAEKKRFVSVRKYFGRKEDIMIVDALTTGNIGKSAN